MTSDRFVNYGDVFDEDQDEDKFLDVNEPFPCPDFLGLVTDYNVLVYKSQDIRIFDRNHFADNGFGRSITAWNNTKEFIIGDAVVFGGKLYNVIDFTNQGESPQTHPEKYSLFTSEELPTTKQGVIDHYDEGTTSAPSGTRSVAQGQGDLGSEWEVPNLTGESLGRSTRNQPGDGEIIAGSIHAKHSFVLNNQRSTTLFDSFGSNSTTLYGDGNNPSTQEFESTNELRVKPFSYVFYDSAKDPVEMEFVMLHIKVPQCRAGHLYLELHNPAITEAIDTTELTGNDHMVYFWGWEGNPHLDVITGDIKPRNVGEQLKQNQQDDILDLIWGENDELLILTPEESEDTTTFPSGLRYVRLLYACRLSDIDGITAGKKMVVGLDVSSPAGVETFMNVLIGMKAVDWNFIRNTHDGFVGQEEEIYGVYSNPAVMPKITFTADDILIKLDETGDTVWDDKPLMPINADSLRSAGSSEDDNLSSQEVYHNNRYALWAMDSNNKSVNTGTQVPAAWGIPDIAKDKQMNSARIDFLGGGVFEFIVVAFTRNLSRFMWFGNFGLVGVRSSAGNLFEVGSFRLTAAKEGQYVLRMPQCFRLNKLKTNFVPEIGFDSYSGVSGHIISLQRGDEYIQKTVDSFTTNPEIDMKTLRTNMTLLDEWTTETFYSSPTEPFGDSGGPAFSALFTEPDNCDIQRYVNIDITEGQGIQVLARFWLTNGKQGSSGDKAGFFQPQLAELTGQGTTFSTFQNRTFFRQLSRLETGDLGDTDFPYRVDLGVLLFNTPREFDIEELATPRANLGL